MRHRGRTERRYGRNPGRSPGCIEAGTGNSRIHGKTIGRLACLPNLASISAILAYFFRYSPPRHLLNTARTDCAAHKLGPLSKITVNIHLNLLFLLDLIFICVKNYSVSWEQTRTGAHLH